MKDRILLCLLTCSSIFHRSLCQNQECTMTNLSIVVSNETVRPNNYDNAWEEIMKSLEGKIEITCRKSCHHNDESIAPLFDRIRCADDSVWEDIIDMYLGKNNCMEGNNNFIVIGVVLGIIVLFLILGFGVVLVCMMRFQNVAGQQNTSPGRKSRTSTLPRFQNPTYSPSSTIAPVQYSSDGPQDIVRLPRISAAKGALDHTYAAIDSPLESHEENQVPGGQRDDDGHYEELDNVAGETHDEPASTNEQDMQSVHTP